MEDFDLTVARIPHGVTDLFYQQAAAKTALEGLLQESFMRWGYNRIIPPTFEYYDTLATQASPQLVEEMIRFFDRSGHLLALRPDMTVGTARIVGTKLYDQPHPLRLYYIGNVFRYVKPQAGRHREFSQAGIELVGAGTPEADAEVLALAVATLRALELSDFQINLGQVAFLQAVLSGSRLANGELRRLEQAIDRRNDLELQTVLAELGVPADAARAIRAIPHLSGDCAMLDEARRLATNAAAAQAIDRLAQVYELLTLQDVAQHVILDLGETRSMAYYTGVAFRAYVAGLGFPICSGGRYDGLLARFGADLPSIGFALGIERALLVSRLQADVAPDVLMAACQHAACSALAASARARGLRVEVDVLGRREDALLAYGRQRGARRILSCCDDGNYGLVEGSESRRLSREQLVREMTTWTR